VRLEPAAVSASAEGPNRITNFILVLSWAGFLD
jgi:hypothetical protein